jgi:glycosyltransferase involved in cell wall biosynthesis
MKVALVYDRVNKWGGAERVLLALHELFPDAPLYTAFYNKSHSGWANIFSVRPSFLQHFSFGGQFHELFAWATPFAFETFNFRDYDVVISVTSAEAKNIITPPETLHICYCLTPTRYLWSGFDQYLEHPGLGFFNALAPFVLNKSVSCLRNWDLIASARPDKYLAISDTVKKRIEKYYHRQVDQVIYPPFDVDKFKSVKSNAPIKSGNFYLTVSRLVGYKRVDLIVDAFTQLGWPLVVIGSGWQLGDLRKRAGENIKFIGSNLTDDDLVHYYNACRAFVYAGEEDFGLVAVEAQAAGKPVICFKNGGMAEIVISGKTGLLFNQQNCGELIRVLKNSQQIKFDADECRKNAKRFSLALFNQSFYNFVVESYQSFRKGLI